MRDVPVISTGRIAPIFYIFWGVGGVPLNKRFRQICRKLLHFHVKLDISKTSVSLGDRSDVAAPHNWPPTPPHLNPGDYCVWGWLKRNGLRLEGWNARRTVRSHCGCGRPNYLLTPWCRVLLEKLTGLHLVKKFPAFTEPEGSLPHSQASATCPYPGPAQSSPYTHIPPPGDPS